MQQAILDFLANQEKPLPTLVISKAVGKTTTREINPTLYRLMKEGKIVRQTEEDGTKPKWSLVKI